MAENDAQKEILAANQQQYEKMRPGYGRIWEIINELTKEYPPHDRFSRVETFNEFLERSTEDLRRIRKEIDWIFDNYPRR